METLDQSFTNPENNTVSINELVERGYDFSISEIINDSFNALKADFGGMIVNSLLTFVLSLGSIFTAGSIQGGWALLAKNKKQGGDTSTTTLMKGFEQFSNHLVSNLLIMLFLLVPMIIFFVIFGGAAAFAGSGGGMSETGSAAMGIGMLLGQLVFMVAIVFLSATIIFVPGLISIGKLGAMDAIKSSFYVAKKQWIKVFLTILALGIIGGLGVILCGVGIFITIPIQYIGVGFLYHAVFGTEELMPYSR